jgi:hypothetical protein
MSEYLATEYEGTRLVPGEPGNADDAWAEDKAMQRAQAVGDVARTADTAEQAKSAAQHVKQSPPRSPAYGRKD